MKNIEIQRSLKTDLWHAGEVLAALLLLITCIPVSMVEAVEGKRVAFVVGIGTYDHLSRDKQLTNAVKDAEGVQSKLTEIGFQVEPAFDVPRSVFNRTWQTVLDGLKSEDTFVLFFSGHGVQIDGQNYLLPRDIPFIEYGRNEQLKREAISLNELLADLSSGDRPHPKSSVVILDACRDNPLIPPGYTKSASSGKGLAGLPESEGVFVMYAAASNRTALDRLSSTDKGPYSVFTRTLLPLIGRTDLSIQELSNELKDQVYNLAKSAGREQRPTYYDGIIGRFCLPGCESTGGRTAGVKAVGEGVSIASVTGKSAASADTSDGPKSRIGKEGAPMVLIPSGRFMMGSTREEVDRMIRDCVEQEGRDRQTCESWYNREFPQHQVEMQALYLDRYEVTNRLFQQFIQQTGHQTTAEREGGAYGLSGFLKGAHWRKPEADASVFDSGRTEHPVVAVSWVDAQAYCRWAGKRLPTEAEFEYAARAGTTTAYWWGQGHPGSRLVENIADEAAKHLLRLVMTGYNDGAVRTAAVGSYEANPWGLHDISGNVAEWTADWSGDDYYGISPQRSPTGPSSGQYRAFRGGSWTYDPKSDRSAHRGAGEPSFRSVFLGFRCAQDLPQ